jgi:hypothetical protein
VRRLWVLALTALVLAVPAVARAGDSNAPPGNSGIDEYLESVPDAGGNRPTPQPDRKRNEPAPEKRAPAAGATVGEAAPKPAVETATPRAAEPRAARRRAARRRARARKRAPREPQTEVAPAAVRRAATGSGDDGMGPALPIILLGSLAAAIGFVLLKRRRAA